MVEDYPIKLKPFIVTLVKDIEILSKKTKTIIVISSQEEWNFETEIEFLHKWITDTIPVFCDKKDKMEFDRWLNQRSTKLHEIYQKMMLDGKR